MVGAERFELPTLWSQTRCATTCATSRTCNINERLFFAERQGLEPWDHLRDHSLAGCCITTLPSFHWGAQIYTEFRFAQGFNANLCSVDSN